MLDRGGSEQLAHKNKTPQDPYCGANNDTGDLSEDSRSRDDPSSIPIQQQLDSDWLPERTPEAWLRTTSALESLELATTVLRKGWSLTLPLESRKTLTPIGLTHKCTRRLA